MCFFHDWVYKDIEVVSTSDDICKSSIYTRRFCRYCGKVQENHGRFKGVQECYYYKNKWFTIGYLKKGSETHRKQNDE